MDNGCATGARPLFARPLISRALLLVRVIDEKRSERRSEGEEAKEKKGKRRKKRRETRGRAEDISDWKEKRLYDAIIRPTKTCIIPKRRVPTPLQSASLSLRLSSVSFSLGGKRSAPYRFSSVTSRAASFFVPSRPPPPPPFAAFAAFRHHTRFPSSPFRETARAR